VETFNNCPECVLMAVSGVSRLCFVLSDTLDAAISCALQCVALCCSVMQCVVVCCSVLQCVAVCCTLLQCVAVCCTLLQCDAMRCSVLQCVAVLQCVG